MPRANVEHELQKQASQWTELLRLPELAETVDWVKARTQGASCVPVGELAAKIKVLERTLHEQLSGTQDKENGKGKALNQEQSLRAVQGYIPKVLGWRPVAAVAKELELHRNTVASLVRRFGRTEMLLYARDHRLYISPEGVELAKEKQCEIRALEGRPTLSAFARELKVPLNWLTAFISNQGMTIEADPMGFCRLSTEQQEQLRKWRDDVDIKKHHYDVVIDGKRYRSIIAVAREYADLLAEPGTPRHAAIARRQERALRFFGRAGDFAVKTSVGTYIPEEQVAPLNGTISLIEAARLMNVSTSTIKAWRRHCPELTPESVPGKMTLGVKLDALLTFGLEKFMSEPKLRKRSSVPAAFAAFAFDKIAHDLGIPLSDLLRAFKVPERLAHTLRSKSGTISRQDHRELYHKFSHDHSPDQTSVIWGRALMLEVGPELLVISHNMMKQGVEGAAAARAWDPEKVYLLASDIFKLSDVWPESFSDLGRLDVDAESLVPFPISMFSLIKALHNPARNVYTFGSSLGAPAVGDILLHPTLLDFGIVVWAEVLPRGTTIQVEFATRREYVTLECD